MPPAVELEFEESYKIWWKMAKEFVWKDFKEKWKASNKKMSGIYIYHKKVVPFKKDACKFYSKSKTRMKNVSNAIWVGSING